MKQILALGLVTCCYCAMNNLLSKTVESRLRPTRMPKDKKMVEIITSFDKDTRQEGGQVTEGRQVPSVKYVMVKGTPHNKANVETMVYVGKGVEPVKLQEESAQVTLVQRLDQEKNKPQLVRSIQKLQGVQQPAVPLAVQIINKPAQIPQQNPQKEQKLQLHIPRNRVSEMVAARPIRPHIEVNQPQIAPEVKQITQLPTLQTPPMPQETKVQQSEQRNVRRVMRRNYQKSPGTNQIDGQGNTVIGSKNYIRGHDNYLNSEAVVTNLA